VIITTAKAQKTALATVRVRDRPLFIFVINRFIMVQSPSLHAGVVFSKSSDSDCTVNTRNPRPANLNGQFGSITITCPLFALSASQSMCAHFAD
jgi:hypothetical protein